MAYHAVTLKDIARVCGVSVNTVSHALHDKSDISAETKALIRKTAREMGYIRNNAASSMRSGHTHTVTLIISDISNPLFGIMAKEIERVLSAKNYMLFIMNTNADAETEYRAVVSALEKSADGIILCPNQQSTAALELLDSRRIPFVLLGRRFADYPSHYVIWNDRMGGYQAAAHLISRGHRRILFAGNLPCISSTEERLSGYLDALAERGIPFDHSLAYKGPLDRASLERLLQEQMTSPDPPTAIFAFSDFAACEILSILRRDYPERRVEVVGFDDIGSDVVFPMDITSVRTPKAEMAEQLVEILLQQIGEPSAVFDQRVIDTDLTVR